MITECSGRRGRRFKSCRIDSKRHTQSIKCMSFFWRLIDRFSLKIINTGTMYKIHSILKSTVDSNISTNHFCRFFAASMSLERHPARMDQTPRKAYIIFLIKKQQQEWLLFLFKFTERRETRMHGTYPFAVTGWYGTVSIGKMNGKEHTKWSWKRKYPQWQRLWLVRNQTRMKS